jgi:hypothetical protein
MEARMSDHDLTLAEREETAAQREADVRAHHQRVMTSHYRYRVSHAVWRANDRVRSGPWCPSGTALEISMSRDFGYWAVQRWPGDTEILLSALFADCADIALRAYAEARAKADADSLEVEP